jgi:hypothetical protein
MEVHFENIPLDDFNRFNELSYEGEVEQTIEEIQENQVQFQLMLNNLLMVYGLRVSGLVAKGKNEMQSDVNNGI